MNPKARPGRSVGARRLNRRGSWLALEPLESRALLSTVSPIEIITPAVSIITPDRGRPGRGGGGGGFGGGGGGGITNTTPASTAVTPADLGKAYALSTVTTGSTSGAGITIAIVTADNDPNIQSDLAAFDSYYKLSTPSLTVYNESGKTTNLPGVTDAGWSLETAMDVEWSHVAAPGAKIVLVEANSASTADLMSAVKTAASLGSVVSMSWGGSEFSGETAYDSTFATKNVTFVAASGDGAGSGGASWPASSPYVVGVGGTTLWLSSTGGYGSETAWSTSGSGWSGYSGSGGGPSTIESMPSYQSAVVGSSLGSKRETPDVSFDANPDTGLAVYSSVNYSGESGWFQVGGTSAGTPVWAGIVATADSARGNLGKLSSTQTLDLLYGQESSSTTYAASFHDILTGSNLAGSAGPGYDVVTGLGTPIASGIINAAVAFTGSATPTAVVVSTPAHGTTTHRAADVALTDTSTSFATTTSTPSDSSDAVLTPVTTTIVAIPQSSVTTPTSTTTSSIGALPAVASLPNQPLSPPTTVAPSTSSFGEPLTATPLPETPTSPGLFLEPVEPQALGDELPALAARPTAPDAFQAAAIDSALADESWTIVTDQGQAPAVAVSVTPVTNQETEVAAPERGKALLAGLAVAIWGAWRFRTRKSDRDYRTIPLGALAIR